MPHNWLNRLFGNGQGGTAIAQNNRDSLFGLPLAPPPPAYQGKINLAARQHSADISRAITSFSIARAQRQLSNLRK